MVRRAYPQELVKTEESNTQPSLGIFQPQVTIQDLIEYSREQVKTVMISVLLALILGIIVGYLLAKQEKK